MQESFPLEDFPSHDRIEIKHRRIAEVMCCTARGMGRYDPVMSSLYIHVKCISCICMARWIQFVVYPRSMLTTCHGKWGTVSSKFQQCLECLRGTVCNGEVLRRIPTACKSGRPAGLLARIHRWTMCQGNLTHADQRPHSRPAVRGNGTERDEEEREKELITTLMPHFIIVSWACLITLTVSVVYTAPPTPVFS